MRKLIKFVLLIIIVAILIPSKKYGLEDVIKQFNFRDIVNTFYTSENVVSNLSCVKNGNMNLVYSCFADIENVRNQLKNINGQSLSFSGSEKDYEKLCEMIVDKTYFTEQFDSIKTVYGYNKKLFGGVKIDNKTINIQIAINNNQIVVGTPVILGSY